IVGSHPQGDRGDHGVSWQVDQGGFELGPLVGQANHQTGAQWHVADQGRRGAEAVTVSTLRLRDAVQETRELARPARRWPRLSQIAGVPETVGGGPSQAVVSDTAPTGARQGASGPHPGDGAATGSLRDVEVSE